YLATNDPSGDPSIWLTYNNVFCLQSLKPSTATPAVVNSTMTHPVTSTTQSTTKSTSPSTTSTKTPSSICSCAAEAMQVNQGTALVNTTFAPITFSSSSDGCDLTAHCEGVSPLIIGLYYSTTVDGNSPTLDMYHAAELAIQNDINLSSLDFQYMRCVNGDWIPYMANMDYLAVNDPNPSMWLSYNNY
ncbi:hypothetical protein PMAYCL1PPCAC_19223, partial [Pristionchus mayeri]